MAPECPQDLYLCQEGKDEIVLGAWPEDAKRGNEDQVNRPKKGGKVPRGGKNRRQSRQKPHEMLEGPGGLFLGTLPHAGCTRAPRARIITLMKAGSFSQGRGGNVPWCVSRKPPEGLRFGALVKLDSLEEGRLLGHCPDVVSIVSWPSRA
jgi:hypothetical protein